MSFGLYVFGFVIAIVGLVYGAVILDVPTRWIAVGTLVFLGLGILKGVKTMRQKDPA